MPMAIVPLAWEVREGMAIHAARMAQHFCHLFEHRDGLVVRRRRSRAWSPHHAREQYPASEYVLTHHRLRHGLITAAPTAPYRKAACAGACRSPRTEHWPPPAQ